MRAFRAWTGAAALLAAPGLAFAQAQATASWSSITFHFERPGMTVSRYTVVLQPDGQGMYWEGPPDVNAAEAPGSQVIHVSAATLVKVLAAMPAVNTGKCETHLRHIAQSGKKTMVLAADGASKSCEFNYSDDEQVNTAASTLQAIAATMQAGDRLAKLHRFDRLGLDAEMDVLVNELKDGRAAEPRNIATVLRSIIDDERVIERVRRKAARLLQDDAAGK